MLLNPKSLAVVGAASTEPTRFAINGILLEPDGSAVATDGHILVKFTPSALQDPKEYPAVEGVDPRDGAADATEETVDPSNGAIIEARAEVPAEALKPFILGRDACDTIGKAVRKCKRATLPILSTVALDAVQTNGNGAAVMAVTDLENPQRFTPRKVDADYPDYTKVVPGAGSADQSATQYVRVGFTLEVLEKLLKTLKALNVSHFTMEIKPEVNTGRIKTVLCPIRVEADTADSDGSVLAIIMPCRLK